MKGKVKAQRKFAQGTIVPVPVLALTTAPNTYPKIETQQEENVVYNKMSAKNLLDIVSIAGIMPQLKAPSLKSAYVRIERLQSVTSEKNVMPTSIIKVPDKDKEVRHSKQTIIHNCESVYLRSHEAPSIVKDASLLKHVKFDFPVRKMKTSNRSIKKTLTSKEKNKSYCDKLYSDDDDEPLISFAKTGMNGASTTNNHKAGETGPEDRSSTNPANNDVVGETGRRERSPIQSGAETEQNLNKAVRPKRLTRRAQIIQNDTRNKKKITNLSSDVPSGTLLNKRNKKKITNLSSDVPSGTVLNKRNKKKITNLSSDVPSGTVLNTRNKKKITNLSSDVPSGTVLNTRNKKKITNLSSDVPSGTVLNTRNKKKITNLSSDVPSGTVLKTPAKRKAEAVPPKETPAKRKAEAGSPKGTKQQRSPEPCTSRGTKQQRSPEPCTSRGTKQQRSPEPSTSKDIVYGSSAIANDYAHLVEMRRPPTSEDEQSTTPTPAHNDVVPVSPHSDTKLYDSGHIETWIDDATFKVPAVPTKDSTALEVPERGMIDDVASDNVSVCPSERFVSLKDVAQAPSEDLISCCGNCRHCKLLEKGKNLHCVLENRLNADDVYEFDSTDNPQNVLPFRSGRDEGLSRKETSCIFLDAMKDSDFVIQLKTYYQDGETRYEQSRVPRANATNVIELRLENESMIDELTLNLTKDSDQRRRNSERRKEKPRSSSPSTTSHSAENPNPSGAKVSTKSFPSKSGSPGKLIDAPVFRPTVKEFQDPITYFEKIMPIASRFGICKVIPPDTFQPPCKLNDEFRFSVTNQYLPRLYSRWGPAARELVAIKAHLASQAVHFARSPLIDGVEVDLPKLYHLVARHGGITNVIAKKRWSKIAEELMVSGPNPEKKLDSVYVKYLLPYGNLADKERNQKIAIVERKWNKKNRKMLDRASNPLHRQKKILQESESSGIDTSDEEEVSHALNEAEDCIVPGRKMNLGNFRKVANTIMSTHFPAGTPTTKEVEECYWRFVILGIEHVCVNAASIDTGEEGYGFTKNKNTPYGKHAWNLKMFSQNEGNVLRALGPVLGVTVPTLHVGMTFSTSCWHSDPQGLPWVEFHHQGDTKIWYGIPQSESEHFRKAVEKLCPTSCQNKSIWLPSDITMIPPNILCENKVSLARVEQNPGEFIIVVPKAYSCSISSGYAVSESVYFATYSWLNSVHQVYQELRDSCEPTMFPLEHLLLSVARDETTSISVLQQVHSNLTDIINKEFEYRLLLDHLPSKYESRAENRRPSISWNVRELGECDICRAPLYLSKVIGITSKKSAHCLEHAKRLLDTPKYAITVDCQKLYLIIYFTSAQLSLILEKVKTRLLQIV